MEVKGVAWKHYHRNLKLDKEGIQNLKRVWLINLLLC